VESINISNAIVDAFFTFSTAGLLLFGMTAGVCMQKSEDREDPAFWIIIIPMSWLFFMLLLYPYKIGPNFSLVSIFLGSLYVVVAFVASRWIGRKARRAARLSDSELQFESAMRDLYE
jgi:uncharacterized BrkB/YihY/UPF0761 family membrane protein